MPMPNYKEVKSILNKSKKRDPWFLDDYTINMYSGCSFNCLFCYIRGSKYGEHMERSMSLKQNALNILDKQLYNRAKKGQYGIIVLSSSTDPYLHFEEEFKQTREALLLIKRHRFPIHIITRSSLIERDLDIIKDINRNAILPNDLKARGLNQGAIISFSFSGIQDDINKIFEPGAPLPSERLNSIQRIKKEDLMVGIGLMPLLPYITDTKDQLNLMLETFSNLNVDYILPASLGLYGNGPTDSKTIVLRAIQKHFPELEQKYHHFFNKQNQMPNFYKNALDTKVKELCAQYNLKNTIINTYENSDNKKIDHSSAIQTRLF